MALNAMNSNRLQFVDRERLFGTIRGVDFGYNLSCIARSPKVALLWSSGSPYTSGRLTCYGSSCLYSVNDRTVEHWWRNYKRVGKDGGRLTPLRVAEAGYLLVDCFDADEILEIINAVRERKTLLIEGGGTPFTPKAA